VQEAVICYIFDDCCVFIVYLCKCVLRIHEKDHPTDVASPLLNTYNPETGCAYYFTEQGNKVRQMPKYVKDRKQKRVTGVFYSCDFVPYMAIVTASI